MKQDIQPKYYQATVTCHCGNTCNRLYKADDLSRDMLQVPSVLYR